MDDRHHFDREHGAQATRLEIIRAAEHLIGECGISSVSLRAISQEAGQRNNSSVQYHFGDRIGLFRAVIRFRETEMEPVRRDMLQEARTRGRLQEVGDLVRIIYAPYLRFAIEQQNIHYMRFMACYLRDVRPLGLVGHPSDEPDNLCPSLAETRTLLRKRLDFLTDQQFSHRTEVVGEMFFAAIIRIATRSGLTQEDRQALFDDTLQLATAAIGLPLGS